MPTQITPQQYGQAVLEHVQSGIYPESEEVISAELPPLALPEVSELIEQAREDVKIKIRKASRDSAPDIDGWISQAKQLRVDIKKSQEIAREIVEQARDGEHLEEQVNDAASKVHLLNGEVAFNKSLGTILERLQAIQRTLDVIQRAIFDGQLLEAVGLLSQVEGELASLSIARSARINGVFEAKVTDLRNHVIEKLRVSWNAYVQIDSAKPSILIRTNPERSSSIDLDSLVTALMKLKLFEEFLETLCKDFVSLILLSRLQVRTDGTVGLLEVDGDEICISGQSSNLSAQALFADLDSMIHFLRTRLPPSVVEPLAGLLMPHLIPRLISTWLGSAVPEDLDGMEDFEDTLSLVEKFAETLDSYRWPGKRELVQWIEGIPNVWLKKRQETSLNHVRKLLSQGIGSTETVERVETQVLSRHDEVFAGNEGGDDWNAGWSDEESSPMAAKDPSEFNKIAESEDDGDVGAWGLDDDKDAADSQSNGKEPGVAHDEAEAWGWGDENEGEETNKPSQAAKPSPKKPKNNGMPGVLPQAEREMTLRETYNITSLPKEILEIIDQVISDAARLETSDYASSPIVSAAPNLLSLPGLVLAMYRASSSTSYFRHPSGQMFLYNDSLWLAERLQHLPSDETTASGKRIQSRAAYNLNLPQHISALESFGKGAYAKEMESQRTIITDLLDGAQGFVHCTEHPFNAECDIAVASTVDRLRQLHRQWKDVLSHSALLQSLGSLLSSVTNKIVVDIEDMSDISEPESQQLTAYCNRIATLEDLFLPTAEARNPTHSNGGEPVPLTAVYTAHWLKFQYLANILESSLIDIKYLWTEGELGLEFDTEELVDLVVALFADSPHRRGAVAEIRGRRGVR